MKFITLKFITYVCNNKLLINSNELKYFNISALNKSNSIRAVRRQK